MFRNHFEKYSLTINIRVNREEVEFSEWLLELGNGLLPRYTRYPQDSILMPKELVLPDVVIQTNGVKSIRPANEQYLIDFVFGSPFNLAEEHKCRAILCPFNVDSLDLNNKSLFLELQVNKFKIVLYFINKKIIFIIKVIVALDRVCPNYMMSHTDDPRNLELDLPDAFVDAQMPSGMPPHILKLKPGCIVMLLRNLSILLGNCN
jgi:hypothetical protein